ncbi:hypothetical protein L2E82_04607 [Cichorium intybus]|uniref:Uncharacterized protein n=1 Tax=Cichorium intybus TaxID=13427 RepID=A0ACB9H727_CICIN|nr:hypothetical protein L2E82_04607 [Cichorium intybus]
MVVCQDVYGGRRWWSRSNRSIDSPLIHYSDFAIWVCSLKTQSDSTPVSRSLCIWWSMAFVSWIKIQDTLSDEVDKDEITWRAFKLRSLQRIWTCFGL